MFLNIGPSPTEEDDLAGAGLDKLILSLYTLGLARGRGRGNARRLSQPNARGVEQGNDLTPSLHLEGLQAQH